MTATGVKRVAKKGATDRSALTGPQAAVLRFLVEHFGDKQAYPTLRQVSARFGWSGASAAICHLKALVRKGWLDADRHDDGRLNLGAYRVAGLAAVVRKAADEFLSDRLGGES